MNAHKTLAMAALMAAAMLVFSPAGMAQDRALKVDIPFEFYFAGKLLPAGTYLLDRTGASNALLRLREETGRAHYVLTSGSMKKPAGAGNHLTFRRIGDASFLAGVYWAEERDGDALPMSTVEKRIVQAGRVLDASAANTK